MKSAITISLVPQAKGGPFIFWNGLADGCERADALGFDAVEIFPLNAAAVDRAELAGLLSRHQLRVAAFGTGGGWLVHQWTLTHADTSVRRNAVDFVRSIIDLAADFDAPAIIGSMQGRAADGISREQAIDYLTEALDELGGHASAHGQTLLYEPLNRYETNLFNRLADAAEFLERIKAPNVRLLADLFHMNIEEASPAEAIRAAGHRIGHVHFADSNRHAVGFGHTVIEPVIEALRGIGYEGYLSAEILPLPDSETAARQTIESIRRHST